MTGSIVAADQLQLEGVFNLRDLGGHGLSGHGGTARATEAGRLFRADGLHRSPVGQRDRLRALGIEHVVDLRTQTEIDGEGRFELDGVAWHHAPIFQSTSDFAGAGRSDDPVDPLCHHFEHMVEANTEPLAAAIGTVADALAQGPTVFHCTAGKDRTGVVAALILSGLGVVDDDVVRDFARSADGVRRMVAWYRENTVDAPSDRMREMGIDPAMVSVFLSAEAVTMESFLARMRARHGSTVDFLAAIGADGAVASIASRLVD